jgi:hypothetical protein
MPYTKTTWVTGTTPISAANMNNFEDGINNLWYPLTVTSTGNRTLILADDGKLVEFTSTGAATCTIPSSSSVAYPTNTQIAVQQVGAGQVTVAGASTDVTLQAADGYVRTREQYSIAGLMKRGANLWRLFGDLGSS